MNRPAMTPQPSASPTTTRHELHWGRLLRCVAERPADVNELLARTLSASADAVAVVDGGIEWRYDALFARAQAVAAGLAARGVAAGDRVAVMLPNSLDAVIAVLATVHLGAIVVPMGTRLKRPEIAWIFEDAAPVALIHAPEHEAELPPEGPAATLRFATGSAAWTALHECTAEPLAAHPVDPESPFGILYTSGTTGRPKGAVLTHLGVVHSCLHWEAALGLTRSERTLLGVPWSHVSGLCGVLMPMLYLGGRLVVMAEFKRRAFLELAQAQRITHALLVPAMYGLCLLEPDLADFDLGDWRLGLYGGAPMPEPTIHRFAQAFPALQMCNCYGATETTSPATIMPPGDGLAHAESIGKVVGCGDIRVMDEQGRELPPGAEGELWIAGPMVIPGYWRNPSADAGAFAGGYWKSGDIGAVDAAGYVRIADRKKDMISRGGYKVYPAEVESVLTGIAGVVEAAVVGRPDEMLGEEVVAFLNVGTAEVNAAAVRRHCAERMADYKVPGYVVLQREPLPRNANGKIQKADLRAAARDLPVTAR